MKRIFDIVVSSLILLLFLPFGILISILIAVSSRGGVFYIQQRVGKDQQQFGLFKFRTMAVNADKSGKLTVGMRDSRITAVGFFLRKYKLDEFPQFINVLSGTMSIVGPRPEVQEYVAMYTDLELEVLKVKPGITDLASLEYFNENDLLGSAKDPQKTYIEEVMPAKLALNKKYIANSSLGTDPKIIWRTAKKIMS